MSEQPTDEALMLAYVAGDRSAFERLFERWSPRLRRTFARSGLREDEAGDLVQLTFLHLHRARLDFHPGAPLRPWIFTIALNLRRQHLRRLGRKPEQAFADDAPAPAAPREDPDRSLLGGVVHAALARLPEAQRDVIALHWFEGLSFREVAEVVGATQTAVKVRAHRGYAKLRAELEAAGVTAADIPSYDPEQS
ncbi:MAG: RNA polymerase sigma factor [Deltaproteobacteria bacterium]|nr:RNA polymerase sigma factor [Nannocystaceae bacterium]